MKKIINTFSSNKITYLILLISMVLSILLFSISLSEILKDKEIQNDKSKVFLKIHII